MPELAKKEATYEDLLDLPENLIGQIIDGKLIATPRPSVRHAHAASVLGGEIVPPYQLGRGGGPGGWVILSETEVMLGEHLLVPDFAGTYVEDDKVRADPFAEIEIELANLWAV